MTDIAGPRRAVNLSLSEDLVRRARVTTRNLSATVEALLREHVEREEARRRAEGAKLDEVLAAVNRHVERHGLLSDEFPSF